MGTMFGAHFSFLPLEPFTFKQKRLTDFLRLLARYGSRRGLVDHKRDVTQVQRAQKTGLRWT